MSDEIYLTFNEEGKAELFEPYCTVIFHTEADFLAVEEAIEKQNPMKPEDMNGFRYRCPACRKEFTGGKISTYCYRCGQKFDWGNNHEID